MTMYLADAAIFGEPKTFAIEAKFLEHVQGFGFAEISLLIDDSRVGCVEDTADLYASCRFARVWQTYSSSRFRPDLDNATCSTIMQKLTVTDWGDDNRLPYEDHTGRYHIGAVGGCSVTNQAVVVMIKTGRQTDRLCVGFYDSTRTIDFECATGVCEKAVEQYCDWAEVIMKRNNVVTEPWNWQL